MPPVTKNLGFVKAIYNNATAPSNTKMLWYDEGVGIAATDRLKYFNNDSASWLPVVGGGGGGGAAITLSRIPVGTGLGIQDSIASITSDGDVSGIRDLTVTRNIYLKSTVDVTKTIKFEFLGEADLIWKFPITQTASKVLKTSAGDADVLEWADDLTWANTDLTLAEDRAHNLDGNKIQWLTGVYSAMEYQAGVTGTIRMMQDDGDRQMGLKKIGSIFSIGVFSTGSGTQRGCFEMTEDYIQPYRKIVHERRSRTEHQYTAIIINGGQPIISLQGGASVCEIQANQASLDWGWGLYATEADSVIKSYVRIDNTGGYTLGFASSRWQIANGASAPVLGTGIHWLELLFDPISDRMIITQSIEVATDI